MAIGQQTLKTIYLNDSLKDLAAKKPIFVIDTIFGKVVSKQLAMASLAGVVQQGVVIRVQHF